MDCEGILSMSYETQHFGFHPRVFFDRIYNDIYETLFAGLNALQDYLVQEYSHVTSEEAIKASADSLFQDIIKKLDKAIDKLELYINSNVFMIPSHVVLPEDKVHITNPSTKEDEAQLDGELEQLKKEILKERLWIEYLKSEIFQQKWVKDELLAFKNHLDQIFATVFRTELTKENLSNILNSCIVISNKMKESIKENSMDSSGFKDLECTRDDEDD